MTTPPKSTRLRITISDDLLAEAMQLTGRTPPREVIEQSLRLLVQVKRQEQLRDAQGFLRGIDTSIDRSDERY